MKQINKPEVKQALINRLVKRAEGVKIKHHPKAIQEAFIKAIVTN